MDNEKKDQMLWQMAKRRAAFKWSLVSYLLVNAFLVAIWYFTLDEDADNYFWPIWPMLGWGLGIAFQYFGAYQGNKLFTAEEEYEKLKKQSQL
jgi:hypothetical protein